MKGKSVGKLLILSSLSVVALFSCNKDNGGSTKNGTPIYACDSNNNPYVLTYLPLKFYNNDGIPYVNVKTYLDTFFAYPSGNNYYAMYSMTKNNDVYTFKNIWWDKKSIGKNSVIYDASTGANTITYSNLPAFVCTNYNATTPLDPVGTSTNGKTFILKTKTSYSYNLKQSTVSLDLDDYSINSYSESDGLYLPLYTVKTLFTSNFYSFFYNGSALFLDVDKDYDNQGKVIQNSFYNLVKKNLFNPTEDYMKYCYNQTLLNFDMQYGMKNITRDNRRNNGQSTYTEFRQQIVNNKSNLININSFDTTLNQIYNNYLDDGGHTVYDSNSYYNNSSPSYKNGVEEWKYISSFYEEIEKKRSNIPLYEYMSDYDVEFITFDAFDTDISKKLYLINEDIKNNQASHIAIDLSMNGGGYVYVAEMFASWLTRGNSICSSRYVVNGTVLADGDVQYVYDLNNNKTIDDGDYLPDCVDTIDFVISNATFSAANYLVCQVSNYALNDITISTRGSRTGGGTCCVDLYAMTPLGSSTRLSSSLQLCNNNSGSIDDNDGGITPKNDKYHYFGTSYGDYAAHTKIAKYIAEGN